MRMNRPFPLSRWTAGLTLLLLLLLVCACAAQPRPGGGAREVPKLKNIKVLKGVPAEEVIPIMHTWSLSLGVRCDFCHVMTPGAGGHPSFEKDGKPEKEAARKMFLMVRDLNAKQKILGGRATCFMCHHGHAEPETKAPEGFGPDRRPGRAGGPGRPGIPGRPGGQPGPGR